VRYLEAPGRSDFERPYGLAWLLQLATEIREWDDPQAREWEQLSDRLERASAAHIKRGCPSSRTRSGSASTARPPLPSV